jgi:uncharacterized membrane protein YeiH
MTHSLSSGVLLYWIMLSGVALGAVTGVLDAGRKGMDIVGACAVGLATAAGGGTVRDLLIGRPVFWVANQSYLLTALGASLLTFFLVRAIRMPARLFLIPDALCLALFTVSGTQIALNIGAPWLVATVMGIVTGTVGGVLRDVLCNDIPLIFLPGEFYAIAAFAGAATVVGVHFLGYGDHIAAIAGFLAAAILRLAAMAFRLRSPTWEARS